MWQRHEAATFLRSKAHKLADVSAGRYKTGHCAPAVQEAIAHGKISIAGARAKDLGGSLLKAGFERVQNPGDAWCIGDIVVLPAVTGHPRGHVAMFDGNDWVSDFVQRDIWAEQAYRTAAPPLAFYRRWPDFPARFREAFQDHTHRRLLLPAGTRLFKFTEHELFGAMSPWWALHEAAPHLDAPGFKGTLRLAEQSGVPRREFLRDHFAVMIHWNAMAHRTSGLLRAQVMRLSHPVPGFEGRSAPVVDARASSADPRPDAVRGGGAHQILLPDLNGREVLGEHVLLMD